jgi:hypothetical protein
MEQEQVTIDTDMMPLEEINQRMKPLVKTKEFRGLTPQQRLWVKHLIATNGDYFLSTKLAYNCANDHSAKTLSYQVRATPAVRAVLAIAFPQLEVDERREFFDQIKHKILKGDLTIAQCEAIRIYCRERSWSEPDDLPPGQNGYLPVAQRVVPVGCTPIKKDNQVIGYFTPSDERVEF